MGRATARPRIWASPSTHRVVGSRCMISVPTSMRLTNEKPQSPLIIEVNQRT